MATGRLFRTTGPLDRRIVWNAAKRRRRAGGTEPPTPPLTALAQILALEPTALWWPSEATMTVARDGTGAAPVAGQPVGRMLDLTANAIHAIAPTDAARPLLGRVPVTGRRNLLTYTEDLTGAGWTSFNVAKTNATKITATATTANHFIYNPFPHTAGTTYTYQQVLTYENNRYVSLRLSVGVFPHVCFDLVDGTVAASQAGATGTITSLGGGSFLCTITVMATTTSTTTGNVAVYLQPNATNFGANWTATGTEAVSMTRAQAETGSTATAYQRVVTALDVTEAGVADTYYASFDGVDDHFALSSSIPITEEMTVVRAFGRSAAGIRSGGLGTNSAVPNDAFWNNSDNIIYSSLTNSLVAFPSPASTSTGNFVTTNQRTAATEGIRRNGVELATRAAEAVGGNFTFLGRVNANYNNGPISFLAVFDRELTGAELALVESIAAGTNGASLP